MSELRVCKFTPDCVDILGTCDQNGSLLDKPRNVCPLGFQNSIRDLEWKEGKPFLSENWFFTYVHIHDSVRSKLNSKYKKCYFIGYGDAELGYRIWDANARKIVRIGNVH